MSESVSAYRIEVTGVVQGVGFRPFVYGLATRLRLMGWVINTSSGVVIEVEGPSSGLDRFFKDLTGKSPPLSRIESVYSDPIPSNGYTRFEIRDSKKEDRYVLVSPDIATCEACRRELFDPEDRRYRYPFINCTNCGPRFTIIQDIPYDRPVTTMAPFQMCPACQAEYEDPLNRRFHAQPNACPVCGPRIWTVPSDATDQEALTPPGERGAADEGLKEAIRYLRSGAILGLKGLGGFHLACDATNPLSVTALRKRKRRPHKPLAVMMSGIEEARTHCFVTAIEQELMTSPASPIVLLEWKSDSGVVPGVAPENRHLGVMLPYTPLHHLLVREMGRPLVMTSGNLSEEPIAQNNEEAWRRLRHLADAFIFHNREIYARYDDSVWFAPALKNETGHSLQMAQPLRRSRGYAPFPVRLPYVSRSVLACGPELKNTFCLTRDQYAFISQHIGDMENLETLEHFEASLAALKKLFRITPEGLICDLHPGYLSTRFAREQASKESLPLVCVQHHHAHVASCMVENHVTEPVIGVSMDGTGFGPDGTIWGGEWLLSDLRGFRRVGWIEPLPLPGGDAGIRSPGRTAIAYLSRLFGEVPALPFVSKLDPIEVKTVRAQQEKGINTVLTSSAGRLFDVVAAMAGGLTRVTYEAQAAIEMEAVSVETAETYPFDFNCGHPSLTWGDVRRLPEGRGTFEVGVKPLFESIIREVLEGKSLSEIGGKFHRTLSVVMAEASRTLSDQTGLKKVALSGGCFQNRLLLGATVEELRKRGLSPLSHHEVPSNDGGISLGQAAIGHFTLEGA